MSDDIELKHYADMNAVADELRKTFRGHGFCLLVFDFNTTQGRMNYISNANRADMLTAIKEFIARVESDA